MLGVEFGVWRVMVGFLSYVVVGIFRVIKFDIVVYHRVA